jgi:hypothetical protein
VRSIFADVTLDTGNGGHAAMRWVLLVGSAGVWVASAAAAQRSTGGRLDPPRVGPHIGYNFDAEALVLGTQLTLPITRQLEVYPSFDYYFIDPGSLWAINADLKFRPPTRRGAFYVGGGLNYTHSSVRGGTGDTNLNILGGLEARRPYFPFVEGRLMLGSGSAFQLVGGFNFQLH